MTDEEIALDDEDPALAEVERLAFDLYKAQDALAFVGECCDIADRTNAPVTTAQVRKWLEGAKCGRQILAERAVLAVRDDELARLRAKVAAFESAGSSSNVTVTMPWPHDPIPDCLTNHCDTHGVDERDDNAYRVCGECGHVFPTEADLLRDYALKRASDVRFCPHCSHDF